MMLLGRFWLQGPSGVDGAGGGAIEIGMAD